MQLLHGVVTRNQDIPTNDWADKDSFKHKAAGYWKHHDRHAIVGTTRDKFDNVVSICFNRVLVVIGDPIHTITSTVRRYNAHHLNNLKASSYRYHFDEPPTIENGGQYKVYITVEEILNGIAETKKDQTGIVDYIMSWRNASVDRSRWPDVRLVTAKTLFNNAKNVAEWIGVPSKDLEPFSGLAYNESKRHVVNITGVSDDAMKEVFNVFDDVAALINHLENGEGTFWGESP